MLDRLSDLVGSSDQTKGLSATEEPQCESDLCVHLGQLPLLQQHDVQQDLTEQSMGDLV